ncbi:MAG: flagellar assembly protein FliW [Clostridium sp.]
MKLNTKYHGVIEYNEDEIITFNEGLLGFEGLKKYIIFSLKDNEAFKVIHSIEDSTIGLVIMSPFLIKEDYEIKLSKEDISKLGINNENEVALYTTVTLNSDIKKITTNLRAPIVLNVCNNNAKQIILENDNYNIRELIIKES